MTLRDFNPDNQEINTESELASSLYHDDINTLKIDKLSNRVTIISIIIPCLIGAILVFAYLDMKERLVDVDLTKKNQFEKMTLQIEGKLNALDVKIAKNKFQLENKLPEFEKKDVSLEGQITKLLNTKANIKEIETSFSKIEKKITQNASQGKKTIKAIKTIENSNKQTLAAIKENQSIIKKNQLQFDTTTKLIKEDTKLFKEEFDARLLELSNYEQQIAELKKNIDLLNKKYEKLDQNYTSQANLDKQVKKLSQRLTTNISVMQKDIDHILKTQSKPDKPQIQDTPPNSKQNTQQITPQITPQITIEPSTSIEIKQEPLTQ